MSDDVLLLLIGGLLTLVVAGAVLNAWLSTRAERARWRRDWTTGRIQALQGYFGDALEAVDDQFRVIGQCADAVQGSRPPVPIERVNQADQRWSRVLARRGVSTPPAVQNALTSYDQARAAAALAVNRRDPTEFATALGRLEAERGLVLDAMKAVQDDMNDALAPHLLTRTVVAWRRLRGRPLRDL
jgi:hypothetical protein